MTPDTIFVHPKELDVMSVRQVRNFNLLFGFRRLQGGKRLKFRLHPQAGKRLNAELALFW